MCLKKSVYSTLIVSASANFNTALYGLLPESKCSPAHTCSSISAAKRVFAEQEFDFVLINSPLPDDTGVRFAIDVCKSKNCVALLLVRSELHDEIYEKVFPWRFYPCETHFQDGSYPCSRLDGQHQGTSEKSGEKSPVHRRKNGRNSPGKSREMAPYQSAADE